LREKISRQTEHRKPSLAGDEIATRVTKSRTNGDADRGNAEDTSRAGAGEDGGNREEGSSKVEGETAMDL
jgi:hypothetical protein